MLVHLLSHHAATVAVRWWRTAKSFSPHLVAAMGRRVVHSGVEKLRARAAVLVQGDTDLRRRRQRKQLLERRRQEHLDKAKALAARIRLVAGEESDWENEEQPPMP